MIRIDEEVVAWRWPMFKQILIPCDFGGASQQAIELAIGLAKLHGSQLTILHVCEVPMYIYEGVGATPFDLLTPITQAAEDRLKKLLGDGEARLPGTKGVFKMGSVHEEILSLVAHQRCDLVVMGTHGRRGLAHMAIGSVAEKVVRLSSVPVLTVHAR
jgi:nucleotide-binding universal stress UspA family protein